MFADLQSTNNTIINTNFQLSVTYTLFSPTFQCRQL
jgi:hypothetical protein